MTKYKIFIVFQPIRKVMVMYEFPASYNHVLHKIFGTGNHTAGLG
jgi:hypothetical protein